MCSTHCVHIIQRIFLCVLLVIDHIQQPNYAILSPSSFTCQQEFLFLEVVWRRHTGRMRKRDTYSWKKEAGGGRSQILRQRGTLFSCKSFNTLWLPASFPLYRCIAMSIYWTIPKPSFVKNHGRQSLQYWTWDLGLGRGEGGNRLEENTGIKRNALRIDKKV